LYHGHITYKLHIRRPHTDRKKGKGYMSIQKRTWKDGYTYRVRVYHKSKVVADATFDTKAEADDFEIDTKAKVRAGTYVNKSAAENMTLSEALDEYNETESKAKKDAYAREVSQARQIKKYPIAKLPLASIKSADIAKFRNQRSKDVGANSVRLALALISDLFSIAIKEWKMDYLTNPVLLITKPSVKKTQRDRRLLSGEYDRLMESAVRYGGTMQYIIPFAVETAMRCGEIASIECDDIDFENKIVHLYDTKNNDSRDVPLSSTAYGIIKSVADMDYNPVFNMTAPAISKAFRRICKRARDIDGKEDEPIVDLHFHDLRHEATTRLFEKGLSTEQVKAITGHKTYSMLARYTHLKASDLVGLLG